MSTNAIHSLSSFSITFRSGDSTACCHTWLWRSLVKLGHLCLEEAPSLGPSHSQLSEVPPRPQATHRTNATPSISLVMKSCPVGGLRRPSSSFFPPFRTVYLSPYKRQEMPLSFNRKSEDWSRVEIETLYFLQSKPLKSQEFMLR